MTKQKNTRSSVKTANHNAFAPAIPKASNSGISRFSLKNRLGIFIAFFSFALYFQSTYFNYAVDDSLMISNNSLVKQGISSIPILLVKDQSYGENNEESRVLTYRPIALVMHAVEWQLSPDNPHLYHLFNVLLFSFNCWLLFILLCKLFENRLNKQSGAAKQNLIFPFITVLLFAAHPIHTEVVDNIKSQDELLCFLFSILSVFYFVKSEEKKSAFKIALATICYILALFSKESSISYLVIIPLILFVFLKTSFKKIIFITLILAVVSGVFLFIHSKVIESISLSRIENLHSAYMNSLVAAPDFITQKATAFYILLRYVFLLIFPYWLSFDYSIAQIPLHQISNPSVLLAILIYLSMGIYTFIKIRKKDILAFSILFYLITLAPVCNIFLHINCTMAERFLFMPSLGFCMIVSYFLLKFFKPSINKNTTITFPQLIKMNSFLLIIVIIITALFSFRTIDRNPDWMDNVTLAAHDVKVVPNSSRAHLVYGTALLYELYPKEKNNEKQIKLLNDAVTELERAIEIYPDLPKIAYSRLGAAYADLGDYKNAIINYETTIRLATSSLPAFVYCDLGLCYSYLNQNDKAINILNTSSKLYPTYADAYSKKSFIYLRQGKNMEAIDESDTVLKYDAKNEKAFGVKGIAYTNLKQYKQSIEFLKKALAIDSTDTTCLKMLGIDYQNLGDTANAKRYFKKNYPQQ